MAGIYIHIPFCKRKCHYCNFFSLATKQFHKEFSVALIQEIKERKNYLPTKVIDSIYFGGGTPSILSIPLLRSILEEIEKYFHIHSKAEITLEANPDDLTDKYLAELKTTMVNRLSIGIQSFQDEELKYINRVHSGEEAIVCIKKAQDTGFKNLSLDLIYGIPNSSLDSWNNNIEIIKKLHISHLSAYSLTQESKTTYDTLVRKGSLKSPDEKKAIQQYEWLQHELSGLKMEQYEISNYAAQEKYALHNTNYWRGIPYLGLGPSAHSFNGNSRRWNIANLSKYIESAQNNSTIFDQEILSEKDRWNEKIMTGLRTKWGINFKDLEAFNSSLWQKTFFIKAQEYIQKKWMEEKEGTYTLSETGKLFADSIAADFFV
jgi:oxygen-independent coproporphyrinogen-3 oxidase